MSILKAIFSSIWHVLKLFWGFFRKFQSAVGTLLFMALVTFIVISLFKGKEIQIPDQGALVISLEGAIQEQKLYNESPLQMVSARNQNRQTILRDVIKSIDLAAEDDRIKMLIVNTDGLMGAMPSKLHYIGEALMRFRGTGKKVVIYGTNYSQAGYLIASYADEIYLHPHGAVLMYGYGSYKSYFKGFLDKIKAEVQLFRVGKYKSAMEPFIRNDMSPAAKEANQLLLGDLWGEYTENVVSQRKLDKAEFIASFDKVEDDLASVNGDLAAMALKYKLVDGLKTREEWRQYLGKELQINIPDLNKKTIDYQAYLAAAGLEFIQPKNIIAVVYANGTIMDGQQPQGVAGGETVSRHLREARLNDQVKAVILRVDSPGGSAFASELIRQEVLQLKASGKPVIVSMGSLAASGGYWISANADEIWAAPTTITGSIGIFGAVPNFEGTLAEIGINTDGVGTTPLSFSGVSKPLPEKIKSIIQSSIENGYDRFLSIVAEGRNMTKEQVHEIAQGRVWTGKKALELGLVDKLGTFDDTVLSAAEKVGLDSYDVVFWEDPVPWDVKLLSDLMERHAEVGQMIMAKTLTPQDILAGQIMERLSLFSKLNDPNHAYLLCLGCMSEFPDGN